MFALHPVLVARSGAEKRGEGRRESFHGTVKGGRRPRKEREGVLAASKSTLVASTRGILMCALSSLTGKGGSEAH